MRDLMKFGMVLVVLALVTSIAIAGNNDYEGDGPAPRPGDPPATSTTWCNPVNWDEGDIPEYGDGDKVRIEDRLAMLDHRNNYDKCGYIHAEGGGIDAGAREIEMRGDATLQIGTATVRANLTVKKDLEMSDGGSSDDTTLDIVNGDVLVKDESEDLGEDGDITINIAAGSSLEIPKGVILGDSNDGTKSTYDFDIAGDCEIATDKNRFEHKGGQLTIDLHGDGTFLVEETSRLSSDDDSVATINITDDAVCKLDKVELGEKDDGVNSKFDYSLEINLSGNGEWDMSGEEMKDQRDGQILNLNITDDASFVIKDLDLDNSDSVINIDISGNGSFEAEDDIDMQGGHISVTENGSFYVNDTFELGDGDDASMTIATTGDVWLGELVLDDGTLLIDGCHVEAKRLDDIDGDSSIEINGAASFAIDSDGGLDMDDLNDAIDDDDIFTSNPGMVIVVDEDITKDGFITMQPVIPVDVDVKPGSSKNPLRVNFLGGGVYPVAIIGTEDFDVTTIDKSSATLNGVASARPGKVGDVNQDGIGDLILKFDRADILDALEDVHGDLGDLKHRAELDLILFADSTNGKVSGSDTLVVLNRGAIKRRR